MPEVKGPNSKIDNGKNAKSSKSSSNYHMKVLPILLR